MSCDIVIVTFNQLEYTKHCIESIEKYTDCAHTIVVVDNNSGPDTVAYLTQLAGEKRITLIANQQNEGWVKAVNKGIYRSDSEYVCVMNNDTVVYPGWLSEMIAVSRKNPAIGVVNPEWQVPKRFPFNRDVYYATVVRLNKGNYVETDWARGFCFLVTRELIRRIGGLDLEFSPGYYDDWDYSLRAIKSGFKIVRSLGSFVWHFKNITYAATTDRRQLGTIIGQKGSLFHERWGFPLRVLFAGCDPWEPKALRNCLRELLADQHRVVFINGGARTDIRHSNLFEYKLPGIFERPATLMPLINNVRHRESKRFDLIVCSAGMKRWLDRFGWIKRQYRIFEASGPDNSHVLLKLLRRLKHEKKTL